ncbi:PHD finger protein 19 [Homalodisca vitripennis]|nr:PHD finger protein 19 [Homalodisca vitripennis]
MPPATCVDQRDVESPTAPDSTTRDRVFCCGDEVLVQRKDGNFYLGTVVEVNLVQEKCLVKFDDNTDHWSAFKHLAKLNKVDNVMCVICKKSQTKKDNEVVVCDRCSRGYHQLCHQPIIEVGVDCWECQRCQTTPPKPLRAMRKQAPAPPPPLSVVPQEQTKNKLPYDVWFTCERELHKSNRHFFSLPDKMERFTQVRASRPTTAFFTKIWVSVDSARGVHGYGHFRSVLSRPQITLDDLACDRSWKNTLVNCPMVPHIYYVTTVSYALVEVVVVVSDRHTCTLQSPVIGQHVLALVNCPMVPHIYYVTTVSYALVEVVVVVSDLTRDRPARARSCELLYNVIQTPNSAFHALIIQKSLTATCWTYGVASYGWCFLTECPISESNVKTAPSAKDQTPPIASNCFINALCFMDNLVWDTHHRVNSDNKYCYCGLPGDWYMKMLQCGRCKQWFHEHCIRCLHYPLYLGDPFYVFVCNLCNNGKEFIRRLEMKWVDLMHLVLFNLTVYKAKKFHEIDADILQYVNNNWNTLQLPPKIQNVNSEDRKSILLSVLANNLSRFKCGEEVKQKRTCWGLRVRIPPYAPNFSLPKVRPINDAVLKDSWMQQNRLKFLPPSLSVLVSSKCEVNSTPEHLTARSPTEPPPGIKLLQIQDCPPVFLPKGLPATGHKVCIKSSFPCFPESREQIQRRIRAQGLKFQRIRHFRAQKARKLLKNAIATTSQKICQELPLTPPSSVSALDTSQPPTIPATPTAPLSGDTSSEDTSSSRTLDSFIPPPKDFEGKNNPFRSVAELLGNTAVPVPPISLTLPLKPSVTQPVLRPTKRRLSEKDIRINRNGEVKRRRLRRQCTVMKNVDQVPSVCWNSAKSLRSMYNPTPNNNPDYINGKKLKKTKQKGLTPTSSPIKQNPTISLDDLKTSVNIYFGAANRIASGEKFHIKAKRITPQGRTQYLIEWGGTVT